MPLTYQEQYIILHGYKDLIPYRWYTNDRKKIENIYKRAIEQNKTWRELTGWNDDKKGNDL